MNKKITAPTITAIFVKDSEGKLISLANAVDNVYSEIGPITNSREASNHIVKAWEKFTEIYKFRSSDDEESAFESVCKKGNDVLRKANFSKDVRPAKEKAKKIFDASKTTQASPSTPVTSSPKVENASEKKSETAPTSNGADKTQTSTEKKPTNEDETKKNEPKKDKPKKEESKKEEPKKEEPKKDSPTTHTPSAIVPIVTNHMVPVKNEPVFDDNNNNNNNNNNNTSTIKRPSGFFSGLLAGILAAVLVFTFIFFLPGKINNHTGDDTLMNSNVLGGNTITYHSEEFLLLDSEKSEITIKRLSDKKVGMQYELLLYGSYHTSEDGTVYLKYTATTPDVAVEIIAPIYEEGSYATSHRFSREKSVAKRNEEFGTVQVSWNGDNAVLTLLHSGKTYYLYA